MNYLRAVNGVNYYEFDCEGCDASGEVGVAADSREQFSCPEGCGASYVQYEVEGTPDLLCVVCPVELDEAFDPLLDDDEVDLEGDWIAED